MAEQSPATIGRYGSLRRRHHALEERIATEQARPIPDSLRLQTLKRRRLRVKEQMAAFVASQRMTPVALPAR